MPHTCQALAIHCIDFRLQHDLVRYLEERKLIGTVDIVSLAGGVRELARAEKPEQSVLFGQIELSRKLHGIQEVHLINHTDCGAYGGASAFPSPEAEFDAHAADLRAAAAVISAHFPELVIHLALAKVDPHGESIAIVPVA